MGVFVAAQGQYSFWRSRHTGVVVAVVLAIAGMSGGASGQCVGDCDGSDRVTIGELILGVNIALGSRPIAACEAFDCQHDGTVPVSCLVRAVGSALNDCPRPVATATPTPGVTPCSTSAPGSILVFPIVDASATNDAIVSLTNHCNNMDHLSCFYAAQAECTLAAFDVTLFRGASVQWQVNTGTGAIPPAPQSPFSGELVCVEVDASGAPIPLNCTSGTMQRGAQCSAATLVAASSDSNDGDNTLCLGASAGGNCPFGAEYDGCPAEIDPARIETCWSESPFSFICAGRPTATPTLRPTPTAYPGIQTYSNRDAFAADTVDLETIDFEGLAEEPFADFANGLTMQGATFIGFNPGFLNYLYVVRDGTQGYSWGSGDHLLWESRGYLIATLPAGITAVGFDSMFDSDGTAIPPRGTVQFTITLNSGEQFHTETLPFPDRAFFGVLSSGPIGSVRIETTAETRPPLPLMDNFSFGHAASAPGT